MTATSATAPRRRGDLPTIRRRIELLSFLFAVVSFAFWFGMVLNEPHEAFRIDVFVYRGGVEAILAGRPLYEPVYGPLYFVYPPFAALLFLPMAWLNDTWLSAATISLNLMLVIWTVGVTSREARGAGSVITRGAAACLGIGFMFLLVPLSDTMWLGQINILLMALVVADLIAVSRGRRWAGIAIGIAAGIKLTPLLFVVLLLWTRRWRPAALALGTFAATVALGFIAVPRDALAFWTVALRDTRRIAPSEWIVNQSFDGVIARFWPDAPGWVWLVGACLVCGAAILLGGRLLDRRLPILAAAVVGVASAFAAPFLGAPLDLAGHPVLVAAVRGAGRLRQPRPALALVGRCRGRDAAADRPLRRRHRPRDRRLRVRRRRRGIPVDDGLPARRGRRPGRAGGRRTHRPPQPDAAGAPRRPDGRRGPRRPAERLSRTRSAATLDTGVTPSRPARTMGDAPARRSSMIAHVFALTAPVEPSTVWRHWVDVDHWPNHFPGLKSARLNGPVAVGAVGLIKPDKGAKWSFRIAEVDRGKKRFAIERKLLFTTLRIGFRARPPRGRRGRRQPRAAAARRAGHLDHDLQRRRQGRAGRDLRPHRRAQHRQAAAGHGAQRGRGVPARPGLAAHRSDGLAL